MQTTVTDVVVVIIGVLVAAALSGVGWMITRFVASLDGMRREVAQLTMTVHADQLVGPDRARRLDDLEDLAQENTTKLAVVHAWQVEHDRWHERRGFPPRPHET